VVELHGNIQQVRCSLCGKMAQEWLENGQDVPECSFCGGLLRPNVVWFGESLPRPALETAILAARACEVFFSIGTSGLVQPAASLAVAAKNQKACVVQVNIDPEPILAKVDFVLTGKSGELLPEIVQEVWG
jgi:NAD-dependent deacetylase